MIKCILQADDSLLESRPARKKRRHSSIMDSTGQARFSVFCQKRRKSIADDHPDFDEAQVGEFSLPQETHTVDVYRILSKYPLYL